MISAKEDGARKAEQQKLAAGMGQPPQLFGIASAALAIEPFAGQLAGTLFAVGILNAGFMGLVVVSLDNPLKPEITAVNQEAKYGKLTTFEIQGMSFDFMKARMTKNGQVIILSERESRLLQHLIESRGEVVTREIGARFDDRKEGEDEHAIYRYTEENAS